MALTSISRTSSTQPRTTPAQIENDDEDIAGFLGLVPEELARLKVVCEHKNTSIKQELRKLVRASVRDSEHLFREMPTHTTRYDKTRPLKDPTKNRGAEVNRATKLVKINVEHLALESIDERALSAGLNRGSFVSSLIVTDAVTPAGKSRRLPKGARKSTGVRVEPRIIDIIKKRATEAKMRPGEWVGRLIEMYIAEIRQKEPI